MIHKDQQPVVDLADWERRAGPKAESQWKNGRSAKEAARHWLAASPQLPADVSAVLNSHPDFGPPVRWSAEPEVRLPIDHRRGESRNTDLLLTGTDSRGEFLVAVEAKADEPFDRPVGEVMRDAIERLAGAPKSGGVSRISDLVASLLPIAPAGAVAVADLRYQLLTAAAGALRYAEERGVTRAVLLIQEFVTAATEDAKHASNQADLENWLHRVSAGRCRALADRTLVGPFSVPGPPLLRGDALLYVAKARITLRNTGAQHCVAADERECW